MADIVQKIREEVERIQLYTQSEVLKQVLDYIDEVQKEEIPPKFSLISQKKCMYTKDHYTDDDRKVLCDGCEEGCEYAQKEEPVSEDLEKASKEWLRPQLDKSYAAYGETKQMELTHFDGYAMLDAIEFGAKWQKAKDESTTEDLGEYINELSKQFQEVSFAKLSRIAVRAAKWKEQQLMANAVEGVVHHFEKCKVASVHYNDPTGVPMAYFTSPEGLSAGDKVKIIVIKED